MTPFQTEKSSLFAYELLFGGESPEGAMMRGRKKAITCEKLGGESIRKDVAGESGIDKGERPAAELNWSCDLAPLPEADP